MTFEDVAGPPPGGPRRGAPLGGASTAVESLDRAVVVVGRVLILGRFDDAGIKDDFASREWGPGAFRLDARGRARRRRRDSESAIGPKSPSRSVVD